MYKWKYNYLRAVIYSAWKLFLALAGARKHYKNYFVNVFYFADIFLNAVSGGHPDVTVSARTGRYAYYYGDRKNFAGWFWRTLETIINKTFEPLDGPDHCYQAWQWTLDNIEDKRGEPVRLRQGPAIVFIPLMVVSTVACFFLFFILRFLKLIGKTPY